MLRAKGGITTCNSSTSASVSGQQVSGTLIVLSSVLVLTGPSQSTPNCSVSSFIKKMGGKGDQPKVNTIAILLTSFKVSNTSLAIRLSEPAILRRPAVHSCSGVKLCSDLKGCFAHASFHIIKC